MLPGPGEMCLILAAGLLLLGPRKLPDVGKAIGETLGHFKRSMREVEDSISLKRRPSSSTLSATMQEHESQPCDTE